MSKLRNLLIRQGSVYGVRNPSKMKGGGVRLNVEMNLRDTQKNKKQRRTFVQNANYNNFDPSARQAIKEFEAWQRKIFAKNAKKGWRFFQPDAFEKPIPRSSKEAWGGSYKPNNFEINELKYQKIFACIVILGLILLVIL